MNRRAWTEKNIWQRLWSIIYFVGIRIIYAHRQSGYWCPLHRTEMKILRSFTCETFLSELQEMSNLLSKFTLFGKSVEHIVKVRKWIGKKCKLGKVFFETLVISEKLSIADERTIILELHLL